MTAVEAAGEDLGKVSRIVQDLRSQFGFRSEPFVEFAFSASMPTYRPNVVTDNEGNGYLFWKTEEVATHVPTFAQVHDKVLAAWKLIEARPLAQTGRGTGRAGQDRWQAAQGNLRRHTRVEGDRIRLLHVDDRRQCATKSDGRARAAQPDRRSGIRGRIIHGNGVCAFDRRNRRGHQRAEGHRLRHPPGRIRAAARATARRVCQRAIAGIHGRGPALSARNVPGMDQRPGTRGGHPLAAQPDRTRDRAATPTRTTWAIYKPGHRSSGPRQRASSEASTAGAYRRGFMITHPSGGSVIGIENCRPSQGSSSAMRPGPLPRLLPP